ncbi:MAG: hypothetical protein NWF11_06035 [Candidatus Bathyarchaeota archaeon]|nr:hypothetical protein [Candidatus Bathyarchaeota archaeon]
MKKKREESAGLPSVPSRPEREGDWPKPWPAPLGDFPPEDSGRLLKRILDRLDAIEKRLESIENMLIKDRRTT